MVRGCMMRNKKIICKLVCLVLCFASLFSLSSCGQVSNYKKTSANGNDYSFKYDELMESINQLVGTEKMFLSIEKTSTHKSYENNNTDLYKMVSMFQEEYMIAIIYDGNIVKSVDIIGERAEISKGAYTNNVDYHVLVTVVYETLNQQKNVYGTLIDKFDITSQDAAVTKTEVLENWIMVYSANNEDISFFFQVKTT